MTYRPAPKTSTLRLYGMSLDDFMLLFEAQDRACAMCRKAFCRTRQPVIDHDHKTWVVRGLACGPCNRRIGFMHDDAIWLLTAGFYLLHPPAETVFDQPRRHVSAPPLEAL